MKAEIWQGKRKAWYWHLKSRNGQIVSDAEAYTSRAHAIRAAKACVRRVCVQWSHGAAPAFMIAPDPKRPAVTIIRW